MFRTDKGFSHLKMCVWIILRFQEEVVKILILGFSPKQLNHQNIEATIDSLIFFVRLHYFSQQLQLNEYDTVLYFLQLSQNLTWDCLLISVNLPVFTSFCMICL